MKKSIFLFLLLIFTASLLHAQYTYKKSVKKEKLDLDLITEFEIGFHAGRNWTLGSSKNIAKVGQIYSLNVGWNNGRLYAGTEFSLKIWDQILNDNKAEDTDFNQKQFLFLLHMRWYPWKGNVQAFLGVGTDLITIAEVILNPINDDFDDYRSYEDEDRFSNYNAWFVPTLGVRCKLQEYLFADVSFSIDHSNKYDSMRMQVGICYQPQF